MSKSESNGFSAIEAKSFILIISRLANDLTLSITSESYCKTSLRGIGKSYEIKNSCMCFSRKFSKNSSTSLHIFFWICTTVKINAVRILGILTPSSKHLIATNTCRCFPSAKSSLSLSFFRSFLRCKFCYPHT